GSFSPLPAQPRHSSTRASTRPMARSSLRRRGSFFIGSPTGRRARGPSSGGFQGGCPEAGRGVDFPGRTADRQGGRAGTTTRATMHARWYGRAAPRLHDFGHGAAHLLAAGTYTARFAEGGAAAGAGGEVFVGGRLGEERRLASPSWRLGNTSTAWSRSVLPAAAPRSVRSATSSSPTRAAPATAATSSASVTTTRLLRATSSASSWTSPASTIGSATAPS